MFFGKVKENAVMSFIKKADKKIAEAFMSSNPMAAKDVVTKDMLDDLRVEVNFYRTHDRDKFDQERLMERTYTLISNNEEEAVVRRDITFKLARIGLHKVTTGFDFSELITISKRNGFAISAIAAA